MSGDIQTKHLTCICYNVDHAVRFLLNKDAYGDGQPELTVDVRLNHYPKGIRGFAHRCWTSIKYIFNIEPSEHGYFDTFGMSAADAKGLKLLLDEYVQVNDKYWEGINK